MNTELEGKAYFHLITCILHESKPLFCIGRGEGERGRLNSKLVFMRLSRGTAKKETISFHEIDPWLVNQCRLIYLIPIVYRYTVYSSMYRTEVNLMLESGKIALSRGSNISNPYRNSQCTNSTVYERTPVPEQSQNLKTRILILCSEMWQNTK
jgi:hypothetical protein